MPQTWFSPYPRITRGDVDALKELDDLDKEIDYLECIISDLKEKRTKVRDTATQSSSSNLNARTEVMPELHSDYLIMVENHRRAETEVLKPTAVFLDHVFDSPKGNLYSSPVYVRKD